MCPRAPWSQAGAALETQLEEKYGASAVVKIPNAKLTAPARKPKSGVQTNKKPQGSVPDGAFSVAVGDAQKVYVLEAKFDGDVRSSALPPQTSICRTPSHAFDPIPCTWQGNIETAERQLNGYAMAAKRLFPLAEIVKVYSHQGITAMTKAEVKKLGIMAFERIGNTYSALE